MGLHWPTRKRERANAGVREWSRKPREAEDAAVALLNKRHSSWDVDVEGDHVVLMGELYNPTDQWLFFVEARVKFWRAERGRYRGYVLACRTVELRMEIPPGESRPFTCVPEPKIDIEVLDDSYIDIDWDYEVTRVELRPAAIPLRTRREAK